MGGLGDQEWAAFVGLAGNPAYSTEERLKFALRAVELLEEQQGLIREKLDLIMEKVNELHKNPAYTAIGVTEDAPKVWKDLIEGLILLSKGATQSQPTHCDYEKLLVMSDPDTFTGEELDRLSDLGFVAGDGMFRSYRYGSA